MKLFFSLLALNAAVVIGGGVLEAVNLVPQTTAPAALPPQYRITIAEPPQVCVVPLGGVTLDITNGTGSLDGVCHPAEWIFSDGFGG